MKTMCLILLLAVLSPALAEDKIPGKINVEFLCQHWMHSREEQQGEQVELYRPANFKQFPPSRFRMQYVFAKDGTCKWMFLSPSDAHQLKDGTWKIDPSDASVLQIVKGETTESYKVIELTKDLLKLKPVTPAK